jgi:hypothetical protein
MTACNHSRYGHVDAEAVAAITALHPPASRDLRGIGARTGPTPARSSPARLQFPALTDKNGPRIALRDPSIPPRGHHSETT